MLKMVAFDLDGTVADTLPMCMKAFMRGVSPYAGHELTREEITSLFGLNEVGMIKRMAPDNWQAGLEGYYREYGALHGECPAPLEGIPQMIAALKDAGLAVAMITGKDERSCRITLNQFGMEDTFADVLTGSEFGNNKRERLIELMNRHGLAPEECLYVGDAVADVRAANGAGVVCLSAAWTDFADADALEAVNPGRVFARVEDAQRYVLALCGR